jgi:DNA invertase Pin-like site-specific DNA recombinase
MARTFGYVRVSSSDQNEARQLIAMQEAGVSAENIFLDKQSGKDFLRAGYQTLLATMKSGDLLYIKSIDRLGRDYEEILEQWRKLTKELGVDIVVLDMPLLDTRRDKNLIGTLIADVVLQLLSFVAQSERENIRQRQAEGIAAAKQNGVHFGRIPVQLPKNFAEIVALWENGTISFDDVLTRTKLKKSTFYRRLREFRGSNLQY